MAKDIWWWLEAQNENTHLFFGGGWGEVVPVKKIVRKKHGILKKMPNETQTSHQKGKPENHRLKRAFVGPQEGN